MAIRGFWLGMASLAAFWVSPALAADPDSCGAAMVCASDPATVLAALQKAGLKAQLVKDQQSGNPRIESDAGYKFKIYFYGCENGGKCSSLQFQTAFADDGTNTPELANKWNSTKRFLQMSVGEDKTLAVSMDVSTVGGLNQKNFADVIDWWGAMLSEVNKFFKAP
jgi:hypothetical protein